MALPPALSKLTVTAIRKKTSLVPYYLHKDMAGPWQVPRASGINYYDPNQTRPCANKEMMPDTTCNCHRARNQYFPYYVLRRIIPFPVVSVIIAGHQPIPASLGGFGVRNVTLRNECIRISGQSSEAFTTNYYRESILPLFLCLLGKRKKKDAASLQRDLPPPPVNSLAFTPKKRSRMRRPGR